jgi:hypothetical protein
MKRAAVVVFAVLLLAACGGGGGGNPDVAAARRVWTAFFSTKTPAAAHVALLQDGPRFKSVIAGFLSDPNASSVKMTVSSVTLEGANKAKVVYSIGVGGFSLGNQTGYAYKQNGKWVVGYAGLCKLVALSGSTPSACKS